MGRKTLLHTLIFLTYSLLPAGVALADSAPWSRLDQGLSLGEFSVNPDPSGKGCGITILRIDPLFYDFRLLAASEHDRRARTISRWTEDFSLVAAINASMYQGADPLKSTGYMRNYGHNNNPNINRSFGAFMAFNPGDPLLPQVQIIDRRLQQDWKDIIGKYHSVVQNYRMVSFGRKIGWPRQSPRHGTAAIAVDAAHHVMFILSRVPFSTHDLIHTLLSLPINIQSAMYVEGGPQAALHLRAGPRKMTWIGICEANFVAPGHVFEFEIPNVIGISKKEKPVPISPSRR